VAKNRYFERPKFNFLGSNLWRVLLERERKGSYGTVLRRWRTQNLAEWGELRRRDPIFVSNILKSQGGEEFPTDS